MEFPNLGEHCTLSSCKQLDFLPLTCDGCRNKYCKEHVKYEDHQCPAAHIKDRRVPVCPLCNQPISTSATDSIDQKVNDHIENDCKSDLACHKRSKRCNMKGCKQRELIPVLCASCKLNFCLRHRHENDHNCAIQSASKRNQSGAAAAVKSGQAAIARNVSSNASSPKSPSERNADRNRFTGPSNSSSLQSDTLTDDMALAMALQASLADSHFQPNEQNQGVPRQETNKLEQEQHDRHLAAALAQSEKDEERRRKQAAESKDSCVIT